MPVSSNIQGRQIRSGELDPVVVVRILDGVNIDADLQVGGADVSNANPVPVSDAGGSLTVDDGGLSLTVDQATHDLLNANANIQVGDADVAVGNPVPTTAVTDTEVVQPTHDDLNANVNLQVGDADVGGANPVPVMPAGVAAAAAHSNEPAANTAAVVTLVAGGAGVSNVLGLVVWSYDLLTVAGTLTIEDGGGTTVLKIDIPESGPGFLPFNPGLMGTANTAMIITLAAGGAGVSGIINVHAWTQG